MTRTALVLGLAIAGFTLSVNPTSAACHKYSHWAYPWAQSCAVGLRPTAQSEPKNWYVEITSLPGKEEIPFPVIIAQYHDELNTLLDARSLDGTKYYKKSWIFQCLHTSSPEQCEVSWEKLSAPCLNSGDTIICEVGQDKLAPLHKNSE
jgi:hypothetical protein